MNVLPTSSRGNKERDEAQEEKGGRKGQKFMALVPFLPSSSPLCFLPGAPPPLLLGRVEREGKRRSLHDSKEEMDKE